MNVATTQFWETGYYATSLGFFFRQISISLP